MMYPCGQVVVWLGAETFTPTVIILTYILSYLLIKL